MNPGLQRTAAGLRRLQLLLRRRANGLLTGDHAGLRAGPGSDPDAARPYRPGEDDVRRIDWPVTARTGELHVRGTFHDHELETWVLLDASASMDFGSTTLDKRELAVAAVAAVAALTEGPGNRLGVASLSGARLALHRPAGTRAGIDVLLRALLAAPRPEPGAGAGADLAAGLDALTGARRRPGLRIVVSDLLDEPRWEAALARMAHRHDVVVIEVGDRRDRDLPDLGTVVLTDPETGWVREVWADARLRERFARAAAAHREEIGAAVRRAGADHLRLDTGSDWVLDVARFAMSRRRVRRVAR